MKERNLIKNSKALTAVVFLKKKKKKKKKIYEKLFQLISFYFILLKYGTLYIYLLKKVVYSPTHHLTSDFIPSTVCRFKYKN